MSSSEFHNHSDKGIIFQSDNGREFKNNILKKLCEDRNIKNIHGSPFHSQSQGAIEKLNHFVGESKRLAYTELQ